MLSMISDSKWNEVKLGGHWWVGATGLLRSSLGGDGLLHVDVLFAVKFSAPLHARRRYC